MNEWEGLDDRMRDEVDPCDGCGGRLAFVGPCGWGFGGGEGIGWAYRCESCGEVWIEAG